MRVDRARPRRYPWWQLILIGLVGLFEALFRPIARMWRSEDPLDTYGLAHLGSVAGDAMVAVALAGSVFFDIPVGEATSEVALYLVLTMAPLAIAGPFLVPLLDRAGPRRAISFGAALGRAVVCLYAAPRFGTLLLFPSALVLLVLAKVHGITRNGLAVAYAGPNEGLVRANARLGRIGVGGAILGAAPALALLKMGGASAVLYGASAAYAVAAMLNLRLPHPRVAGGPAEVSKRGAIPQLAAPAIGAAGLRAASGFLLFALAFALRRGGEPTWWFGALAAAATAGGYLGNVIAPRLPSSLREEAVVVASVAAAGSGALVAFVAFELPVLAVFALVVGATSELGRLAFQTLMQRLAPGGAHGRVFVRYEVMFQLAWVGGALVPAVVPIDLRGGFLILAVLYLVAGVGYLTPDLVARRREERA
ncbi:MAG TPA: hypothetical protein VJO36_09255 [Actinomycetota bacterium]|nr:hypothetical protein [Actinomycetota bacterium]